MRLKTLIVDDEPVARRILREELEAFPEIGVIGEAADGKEALRKIEQDQPDLVFLDLQMPVMGGFDVVRVLRTSAAGAPVVVIVTAYSEHAIRAFEEGAVDYLLKPVSAHRLRKSIQRAMTLRGRPAEAANEIAKIANAAPRNPLAGTKIIGRSDGEFRLLDPDEVYAFQAEAELVWIVTIGQRLLAGQSLKALERRFEGTEFKRIHRNAIVNVNHIRSLSALSSQRWLLILDNSLQLVVSKRQAHTVRKLLR